MMIETDAEFVERLAADRNRPIYEAEMSRLFALARRGAEANAKWQAGYNAAKAASLPPTPKGANE